MTEDALLTEGADEVASAVDVPPAVVAAGALCWRAHKGHLEVLLIHRPRYDDWSWPKGKMDAGETIPEAAVREVREEIGVEATLGRPLPTIRYPVSAGLKDVHYWAAKIEGIRVVPDGKEVDAVLWCTPEKALEMLTNPSDREPLEALSTAYGRGDLDTWPLIIVRHAKAKPRSAWTRAEGDRPLAATGLRQALAVQRLLMAWQPSRIVSSPWLRCVATVSPYVKATGTKLKLDDALTEAKHQRHPRKTAGAVEGLFDKRRSVALCTHRPALPTVLDQLGTHMSPGLRDLLPSSDPYLSPGEMLIFQVSAHNNSQIVSVEKYRPFDD